MACRGRYPCAVHAGFDLDRCHCWIVCEISGWRRCLFLPAYLPSIYQFGVCAHRINAASGPGFAENQPVTSIVEAIRAQLSGQPVGNDIWVALGWCVGIMLVAYIFAMRVYKKRV